MRLTKREKDLIEFIKENNESIKDDFTDVFDKTRVKQKDHLVVIRIGKYNLNFTSVTLRHANDHWQKTKNWLECVIVLIIGRREEKKRGL